LAAAIGAHLFVRKPSMPRPSSPLLGLPAFVWRLLLAAAIVAVVMWQRAGAAECGSCQPLPAPVTPIVYVAKTSPPSWIFAPSRYTHDPETGARVAQYAMKPPIEPLDDPRLVTSGYSRSRSVLRGADGSVDTYYRVTNYGNGRGGMDAEWERFHDAWRGSTVAGGNYQVYPGGYGYGYGGGGYPGYGGGPGYGAGPGYGPGYGGPGYAPGYRSQAPFYGYGPGYGQPDAGTLDPDGADGYREQRPRTPDREFFNGGLPPRERRRD
jgi:hypothetical protein